MSARVIPTMSQTPAASAASACSTVITRPATITGTLTTERVRAARSLKRPLRMVEGRGDHRLVLERLGVGAAHHPVVGDSEAVDQARDLEQLLPAHAARHEVVAAVADADDELGPDGVADGPQHLADEAAAVLEGAAVLVRALVGERREEVLEEMPAVEGDVAAVVAALLEPDGGGGPGVDHLADLRASS